MGGRWVAGRVVTERPARRPVQVQGLGRAAGDRLARDAGVCFGPPAWSWKCPGAMSTSRLEDGCSWVVTMRFEMGIMASSRAALPFSGVFQTRSPLAGCASLRLVVYVLLMDSFKGFQLMEGDRVDGLARQACIRLH